MLDIGPNMQQTEFSVLLHWKKIQMGIKIALAALCTKLATNLAEYYNSLRAKDGSSRGLEQLSFS